MKMRRGNCVRWTYIEFLQRKNIASPKVAIKIEEYFSVQVFMNILGALRGLPRDCINIYVPRSR